MAPIWWDALPPPRERFRSQGGDLRVDVAIVGGGLTGLSSAWHLLRRRPGARVMVLEADRIGAGASGRTTGMLGPGVGQSLIALCRRVGETRARALYAATLDAVQYVAELVGREKIECELSMTGQVLLARSSATRRRLRRLAALLARLELPHEALDDEGLARVIRLAPAGRAEEGPAALRLPVAGTLHPGRLLAGLVEQILARGGTIHEGARVVEIQAGRPVKLVLDGGGTVIAADVVLGTAGYTAALGVLRGRVLPVHLQVLVTDRLGDAGLRSLGWAGREGILDARRIFNYFRLTADDRIVFGGGEPRYRWGGRLDDGCGGERALDLLARELGRTFPTGAGIRVAGGWTGVIGYVVDALPAIAGWRDNPAVLHAVGWCGHGIALAVAAGAWVTSILCDRAVPNDLPWFRDAPPLLPFEPARWIGFRSAVGMMSLLDRIN